MKKNCKYCHKTFKARRRNHVYCCSSCKTMASYKRNDYKYVAGHYQKQQSNQPEANLVPASKEIESSICSMEERVKKMGVINVPSISNAAIGSLAASTAINGAKRLFAPNALNATKGDVETLKKEINELKKLIQDNNNNKNTDTSSFWLQ